MTYSQITGQTLLPCYCGCEHLEVTLDLCFVDIFCTKCGRTSKAISTKRASYERIGNVKRHLLPKAIKEWNEYTERVLRGENI